MNASHVRAILEAANQLDADQRRRVGSALEATAAEMTGTGWCEVLAELGALLKSPRQTPPAP